MHYPILNILFLLKYALIVNSFSHKLLKMFSVYNIIDTQFFFSLMVMYVVNLIYKHLLKKIYTILFSTENKTIATSRAIEQPKNKPILTRQNKSWLMQALEPQYQVSLTKALEIQKCESHGMKNWRKNVELGLITD